MSAFYKIHACKRIQTHTNVLLEEKGEKEKKGELWVQRT